RLHVVVRRVRAQLLQHGLGADTTAGHLRAVRPSTPAHALRSRDSDDGRLAARRRLRNRAPAHQSPRDADRGPTKGVTPMTMTRRSVLKRGALASGALALGAWPPRALGQGKDLNLAAATFNLRDPILQEFTKRTGITVKPWINPSAQARADRIRVAPVDNLESGADFIKYAWEEKLIQPIDLSRVPGWKRATRLFVEGQATPQSPLGSGDNPGRMMYVDKEKTQAKYVPSMYQFDSIAYNPEHVPARDNVLSWGELFNPKWRGKAALYGIEWLGMLDAALGMHALGLLKAQDLTNLTEKEVDTVILFLKEKKKEGHFRAFWKAFGELVNLMTANEVWIADGWWPTVMEVRQKGTPGRYAEAEEGNRAVSVGSATSGTCK